MKKAELDIREMVGSRLTRKADGWGEIVAPELSQAEVKLLEGLSVLHASDILHDIRNPLSGFKVSTPIVFLMIRGPRQYIVNTEGYDYARYIGLISIDLAAIEKGE